MFDIQPIKRLRRYEPRPVDFLQNGLRSCNISRDGKYRYRLTESIGTSQRHAVFVMLNPSTADHTVDDPTWKKCVGFASRWGCGQVTAVNLFGFRATDPSELRKVEDPEGMRENLRFVATEAAQVFWNDNGVRGHLIAAWGTKGAYLDQDISVMRRLKILGQRDLPWECLGVTKDGHPKHPLYVSYDAKPQPFTIRSAE